MKSRLNKRRRVKYRKIRDVAKREARHVHNQAIREGQYDLSPPRIEWPMKTSRWDHRPNRTVLSEGET